MINSADIDKLSFINSEIQTLIMFLSVVVTGFLTFLLWKTTKRIGEEQTQIQEKIANNNIEFQRNQDKNNYKLALYQSRLNCYFNVLEVFSSPIYDDFYLFIKTPERSDLIKTRLEHQVLLFKTMKESKPLFNTDIQLEFERIYKSYSGLYYLCERPN